MESPNTDQLPIQNNLDKIRMLAMVLTTLMAGLSIIGLILSEKLYPTQEFVQSFMTNDIVNLVIGVPILIAAILLIRANKLIGLLLLPGSLLYVVYNSIAYVFGRPFDLYSTGHLVLILVCIITAYLIFTNIDHQAVRTRLEGRIPRKFSGWVLTGFGALFFLRAVAVFASSLLVEWTLSISEVGVLVADMVLSVLLFLGGIWLLRARAIGFAAGLGLIYAASMLFIGLIILLIIQAVITGAPIPFIDILVLATMGSVCFIPFYKYLQAAA